MTHSPEIDKLAAALVKVQASIKPALKTSVNPHFKSHYADLSEVWGACREALTANGFAVVQGGDSEANTGAPFLTCTLVHTSGQWISGAFPLLPVKNDPQALCSAISYLRRYSLAAMVGVVTEDDDGEAAMARGAGNGQSPQPGAAATVRQSIPRAPQSAKAHSEQWKGWANDILAYAKTVEPEEADAFMATIFDDLGRCMDASENLHGWLADKLAEILDSKRKVA